MSAKYARPPIVEALCEFRFIASQPYDMTIPGLFYEKIRNDFPDRQQKAGVGIDIKVGDGTSGGSIGFGPVLTQFLREDKSALVQVGSDLLSVNHLVPYTNWETFKPMILNNLQIYRDIAEPGGLKRIGLRYMNKIDLSKEGVLLRDFFNYYPLLPEKLPQIYHDFNARVIIPYENGRDRLVLGLASIVGDSPDTVATLLDLDYSTSDPQTLSLDEVGVWLEAAHNRIENAFEAAITDNCRQLFEKE